MRKPSLLFRYACVLTQIRSMTAFSSSNIIYNGNLHIETAANIKRTFRPKATFILFNSNNDKSARDEAEELLERAKKLRESIPTSTTTIEETNSISAGKDMQNLSTDNSSMDGASYRLYVDIGREPGTWMDPRWGASGERIEFTIDMMFLPDVASKEDSSKMVKDNFGGKSSQVMTMQCLSDKGARLRRGFDSMNCYGGGYRLDYDKKSYVARFFIDVEGVGDGTDSTYGDLNIPKGCLYFSIPCFGGSLKNLSMKEGPVTVRQIGWHTGWRREESRIVGIFKALPLEKAKIKDKF